MAAHLVDPNSRPNGIVSWETRKSQITGIAWYAILTYKEHRFEELLPYDFPAIKDDELRFALEINPILERMRAKLAPILVMEDEAAQEEPSEPYEGDDEISFFQDGKRLFVVSRFKVGHGVPAEERIRLPLNLIDPKTDRECYLLAGYSRRLSERVARRKERGF